MFRKGLIRYRTRREAAAFARDIDRDETRGTDRATQFETERQSSREEEQ